MAIKLDTKEMKKPQKLPTPQIRWIASLSDGSTFVEGKGEYQHIDGQPSPWNRLTYSSLRDKKPITSLSLITPDGRLLTLPPIGKFAKFRGYADRVPEDAPEYYEVQRFLARDTKGFIDPKTRKVEIKSQEVGEFYTIAEAHYHREIKLEDKKNLDIWFKVQLWVDEKDPRKHWVAIRHY